MAWNDPLVELRDVLANLYVNKSDAAVVVEEAGLPLAQVEFADKAVTNWHGILREAHRRGKVRDIVDVARRQYAGHAPLAKASQAYEAAIAAGVLTVPGTSETIYGWDRRGLWMLGGAGLSITALISLATLYLQAYPAIAATASVIFATLTYLFDWFGIRKEKAVLQRLSHRVGSTPALQTAIVIIFLSSVGLWVSSASKIGKIIWGPEFCGRAAVNCLMIAPADAVSDDAAGDPEGAPLYAWTPTALRMLEQKLGVVPELKMFATPRDPVSAAGAQMIDYHVRPWYEHAESPMIGFSIFDSTQKHMLPDPNVVGYMTATPADVQEQRNQLIYMLLERLGIETPDEVKRAILETPTDSVEAMQRNNEGVELLQQGRVNEAEARFRAALAIDPGYSVALANLGYIQYYYQGHLAEAITSYESAVELLDSYAVYHYNLARLYLVAGREEDAISELTQALARRHGYVEAYNDLGYVYLERRQWSRARLILEEGINWDPSCASLYRNLGSLSVQINDADAAIRALHTALVLEAAQLGGSELGEHGESLEPAQAVPALNALYAAEGFSKAPLAQGPACGLGARGLGETLWLMAEAYAQNGAHVSACEVLELYWTVDGSRVMPWATAAENLSTQLACE